MGEHTESVFPLSHLYPCGNTFGNKDFDLSIEELEKSPVQDKS